MEAIFTSHAPKPIGPYSQAVRAGNFLWISGQIPISPQTSEMESGDIQSQAHRVLLNLKAVLEAAGAGIGQVVKTTVFMTDLAEFAAFNGVYGQYFTPPFPARSTVQVAALPGNAKVELEAWAYLGTE